MEAGWRSCRIQPRHAAERFPGTWWTCSYIKLCGQTFSFAMSANFQNYLETKLYGLFIAFEVMIIIYYIWKHQSTAEKQTVYLITVSNVINVLPMIRSWLKNLTLSYNTSITIYDHRIIIWLATYTMSLTNYLKWLKTQSHSFKAKYFRK